MTAFRLTAIAAALVLAALPAFAQTDNDHAAHHPEGQPAPQAQQALPGMAGKGMMGMSGDGMTAAGGMTGGDSMMGTMGGGGMMGMMGGPGMMPMMAMMGARHGEHVEGRLAFLKTELKITEAEMPQWNAFADAVRANAKSVTGMRESMAARGAAKTLPDRLALAKSVMSAHLEALDKTTEALTKLYDVLSAEQKKTADEIVIGPMGMPMGMM
jgi:hypothetical protein